MTKSVACPKCGSPVEGATGFGMVACPKCGEFILMGGEQQREGVMEGFREGFREGIRDTPLIEKDQGFEFSIDTPELPAKEEPPTPASAPAFEDQAATVLARVDRAPITTESAADPVMKPAMAGPSPFADVVEFANNQQVATGTGGLVYDVTILGIDTVDIRQEVAACLSDKRLKLDGPGLMKTVNAGELTLNELNPVCASVLVSVLKHLSLTVSWKSRQLIKGVFVFFILAGFAFSAGASDWARHEVNLKGYATKIENMQDEIRLLIEKKNQNKDPEARDDILKEIIKKNLDLTNTYKEFKKEKEHIRFEHPEQGDKTERKYRHVKMKSLDELEDEVGLQGQLSRVKKKVETAYPSSKPGGSPNPSVDQD